MVYSQCINKNRFHGEARSVFNKVEDYDRFISIQSFYKDRFSLVIDLCSLEDNAKHSTGKKIVNIQSSVLLELSKLATNLVVTCRIYVLSDGEPSVLFGMAWGFREGSHKVPISPPGCLSG